MDRVVVVVVVRVVVQAVVGVEHQLQVDAGSGERHLGVTLAAAGPEATPSLLDRAVPEAGEADLED